MSDDMQSSMDNLDEFCRMAREYMRGFSNESFLAFTLTMRALMDEECIRRTNAMRAKRGKPPCKYDEPFSPSDN